MSEIGIGILWVASIVVAYFVGYGKGNQACNKWWNQYGAQIFKD
jgi:hypothetical protein